MSRHEKNAETRLFDDWPDRYDAWFTTPIGKLVKSYELELVLEMLQPKPGEHILDVGCGTGVFTLDILASGVNIIGLDISYPMLVRATHRASQYRFAAVAGDMLTLPFPDESFDKTYSITALEFIHEGRRAATELSRVTRSGGTIVLATLNSLSPWAIRRSKEAKKGHSLFQSIIFRSPQELASIVPGEPTLKTAIHFLKDDDPQEAPFIEREGANTETQTGAFVAAVWSKEAMKEVLG